VGLGLTLSQSLAESMGGSLELGLSAAGRGARFELLLPQA
jgi:C4-dicarboxylate-specific signal transduction histidine kinase